MLDLYLTLRNVTSQLFITSINLMPQGTSGRVVIDLDPEFKEKLYSVLKDNGLSMKEWFLQHATAYCDSHLEPQLDFNGRSKKAIPAASNS